MTALHYSAGTVSLTAGSAVVTGIDTAWAIALLKGGEIFVQAPGNPLPIETIDSDTQITAALVWTGETGVYEYVLRVATTYDQQIAKNAEVFAQLRAEIEAGTIWKFDVSGVLADRDTYDTRPRHFSFLEFDDPNAWLWVKASNAEGDWAGPFAYGVGPEGQPPSLSFSPIATGAPGTPASLIVTGSGPYNLAFTIPAGLTGLRWRGAYNAGTSYLERDGVRDNGSTWIALQDTLGNAPPVLPATSNAFWELVAAKGLDGTGTGDVVGPAGALNGRPAVFDGTSGKLLREGPIPFSGAYADLSGKPTLGAAAAMNVGSTAGTVAAGDDPRFTSGGNTRNEALLALEIADLKGSRLGMIGGVADAFDDETGVDTVGSVNAAYDAANDWYMPVAPAAQTDGNGSSTTGASLFTLISRVFALRNGEKMVSIGVQTNVANDVTVKIVQRNSATNYTVLQSHTFAHPGGGWFDFLLPVPFDVPASGTFHVGAVQIAGQTILTRSAARAYLAGDAPVGPATSGWTEDSSGARPMRASYLPTNMSLKSVSYTAQVAPTKGRLSLQIASGAPTINVDLLADISRDGGITWTTANLALASSFLGIDMFEAQNIDISAQPSGTAMQWRVRTQNNKPIAVSGVVMQWS
ncbi:hypothetical protein B5M44_19250 [Shinella sumterensis]|uniref:hypothetical protein n=1 Tax=Shinella sumterensis TaxID=1967501 RepID=UPI00106E0749|nr:hypothetical protein [Shinella sumterensis]MCD1266084.1 hypothetical protein [Shinella sumterensis]TFE96576.1 hypothetical protein B5M44_19250 [Shinella sumterensis]